MKKLFATALCAASLLISACGDEKSSHQIKFAVSSEYPPFEFQQDGKIVGFDIDLANMIAKELNKEAVFEDMQFSAILPSVESGSVDAAISTFTVTEDRQKNFDFSVPYYQESFAVVFSKDKPLNQEAELAGKKIAAQLGSTMETWLKAHFPANEITVVDNNNQAIEALKAGHVDGVLVDGAQGSSFSNANPGLGYAIIAKSDQGYAIVFKKNSPLREEVNKAIKDLETKGEIKKLEEKWVAGK